MKKPKGRGVKRLFLIVALVAFSGCAAVKGTVMTYTGLSHPTLIENRLYLMNRYQANDPVLLKALGIQVRVNVASQVRFPDNIPGIDTFNIPIHEKDCTLTWMDMGLAYQIIQKERSLGRTVGDNCWFGENRSALLDAIILSEDEHMTVPQAFARLKIYRPEIYWKPWMDGYKEVFKWLK